MGNIYPHSQNICSTGENNISSIRIAKYLVIQSGVRKLDKEMGE
jgi:hypothetical protein